MPLFVHDDRATARHMISGSVGSFARFSVMHGTVAGPVAESQRDSLTAVHRAYDMTAHFTHGSPQSKELTDEVIDAFGIAGPASYCIERLIELREMGLTPLLPDRPAAAGADRDEATRSPADRRRDPPRGASPDASLHSACSLRRRVPRAGRDRVRGGRRGGPAVSAPAEVARRGTGRLGLLTAGP